LYGFSIILKDRLQVSSQKSPCRARIPFVNAFTFIVSPRETDEPNLGKAFQSTYGNETILFNEQLSETLYSQ
jgi:hypothetical protein